MGKKKVPFDKFAAPLQDFNIEGEPASKSWFGFTATIIFFVLVSIVFISGAVSMFQRKNLTVSYSEEGTPDPPPTNIKDLLMAFSITDRFNPFTPLIYGVDIAPFAGLQTWVFKGVPKELEMSYQALEVDQCTREYFGTLADEFDKVANIQDLYCISKNQNDSLWTLEGQLGSTVLKTIYFDFICMPNATTGKCLDSFVSSNVIMYYASNYVNSADYDNPITPIVSGIVDRADAQSYHEKHIIITPREIITDTGLIFEDLTSQTDLIISEGQDIIEGVNPISPTIIDFVIQLDAKKIVINRSYKKIFDVLATTTGIASTIGLIFGILIKPYVELRATNDIVKAVIPNKYIEIQLKDFLQALVGIKEAREKVKRVKENKEWVVKNFDVIRRIKNWNDCENERLKPSSDDHIPIKVYDEVQLYEMKEKRSPVSHFDSGFEKDDHSLAGKEFSHQK